MGPLIGLMKSLGEGSGISLKDGEKGALEGFWSCFCIHQCPACVFLFLFKITCFYGFAMQLVVLILLKTAFWAFFKEFNKLCKIAVKESCSDKITN